MKRILHVVCLIALAAGAAGLQGCFWLYDRDAVIDGIEFVECPAGEFQMGDDTITWEAPAHTVTFAKKFWISQI